MSNPHWGYYLEEAGKEIIYRADKLAWLREHILIKEQELKSLQKRLMDEEKAFTDSASQFWSAEEISAAKIAFVKNSNISTHDTH